MARAASSTTAPSTVARICSTRNTPGALAQAAVRALGDAFTPEHNPWW